MPDPPLELVDFLESLPYLNAEHRKWAREAIERGGKDWLCDKLDWREFVSMLDRAKYFTTGRTDLCGGQPATKNERRLAKDIYKLLEYVILNVYAIKTKQEQSGWNDALEVVAKLAEREHDCDGGLVTPHAEDCVGRRLPEEIRSLKK